MFVTWRRHQQTVERLDDARRALADQQRELEAALNRAHAHGSSWAAQWLENRAEAYRLDLDHLSLAGPTRAQHPKAIARHELLDCARDVRWQGRRE